MSHTIPDLSVSPDPHERMPAIMRLIEKELNNIAQRAEVATRLRGFESTRALEQACKHMETGLLWLQKAAKDMERRR